MRMNMLSREHQSALQIVRIEYESELRAGDLQYDEEVTELRRRSLSLELEVERQRQKLAESRDPHQVITEIMGGKDQHSVSLRVMHELQRVQSLCDEKESRMIALREEMDGVCLERDNLMRANAG